MAEGKNCLLLGAGLMAVSFVGYLSEKGVKITVASRTLSKAQDLVKDRKGCTAVEFDVEKEGYEAQLEELIKDADVVVSLLPWVFHMKAAKVALKLKTHFCTSSYVSDEMAALDEEVKAAGLVFMNEVGVDPGLDHMSAMQIIDRVHSQGGKVLSFLSYCGGLPAPDSNTNPFGYKLSWSPRGVLLATGKRDAKFIKDGKETMIPGPEVFNLYEMDEIPGISKFERYPNGDSTKYDKIFGIPEVKTLIRGTYRYPGWCGSLNKMLALGVLDVVPVPAGVSYLAMTAEAFGAAAGSDLAAVKAAGEAKLGAGDHATVFEWITWLGLLDDSMKVPEGIPSRLDAMVHLMDLKMQYAEGERDMIAMKHDFEVEYADGKKEHITSTMIDYGTPGGFSSMAKTVSYPLGIAVRMVLDGSFAVAGVQRPIIPEIYNPLLAEMETHDVKFVETSRPM